MTPSLLPLRSKLVPVFPNGILRQEESGSFRFHSGSPGQTSKAEVPGH